jgi:hypothetical protein
VSRVSALGFATPSRGFGTAKAKDERKQWKVAAVTLYRINSELVGAAGLESVKTGSE